MNRDGFSSSEFTHVSRKETQSYCLNHDNFIRQDSVDSGIVADDTLVTNLDSEEDTPKDEESSDINNK